MMKSNFLNLPFSATGDARRHVPFRSIINKHFSILFVLVFVFSILFSYVHPVAAFADPVFQPVYDTQFYQLPQFVDPLNSTQQDIFYFILGSQVVEYAGLSDYQIENPYSDPSSVGEWFKKIGIDLYNNVLESFAIAGAPVIASAKWVKDLYANIAGAANFAGAFNNTSFNDWFSDVQTNGLSLQLYPSMFGALNQFFASQGGLYNWQNNVYEWVSDLPYQETTVDSALQQQYFNFLYPPNYSCRLSTSSSTYNHRASSSYFETYRYIFINTSSRKIFIVNSSGSSLPNYWSFKEAYYTYNSNNNTYSLSTYNYPSEYNNFTKSYPSGTNLSNIIESLFNGSIGYPYDSFFVSDFIDKVYYGNSWDSKVEAINSQDLNISASDPQDVLTPIINTLLDIKGLINDILEQNELKQPALDNITDLNGDPLLDTQLQPISVAVELPDSGINIPNNLFSPLTKEGGYISYLWFMTKPLVQYTSDFVQTMVFDGNEDFDITGPGAIVFGVISLGLIGGLVVKCLL